MSRAQQILKKISEKKSFFSRLNKKKGKKVNTKSKLKKLGSFLKKLFKEGASSSVSEASGVRRMYGYTYYSDGGAGEFYTDASISEVEKFIKESMDSDDPAPFKIAVNDGDGLNWYEANSNDPSGYVDFSDLKSELEDENGGEEPSDEEVLEVALEVAFNS